MTGGEADIVQIVVLAAGPDALLTGGGATVIYFSLTGEHVFELVHPGIGEKDSGIVKRDNRR